MAVTITYQVINGEFDITVTLASTSDPLTIIATNVHSAYGVYTFDSVPEDDYILTFTDALGCTFPLTVCDLAAEITDIVYPCEFDFTINWVETMPSPSRTPTPSPTQPPTPTPTPTITITPTVSCARPGGLTLYNWWYISGSTGYVFYNTLGEACYVLSQWNISTTQYQGIGGFIASTAIGEAIYPGGGTSCNLLPDGFWIRTTSPPTSPTIVQVLNGHIYAYPPCPSPTLTPTPTITPTKTPTPTITLSKTPSRTPTATRMASRTPTPTPTITPSTSPSAPNFKITGVIDKACTPLLGSYFIQIFVSGGTAPYQYSIDNGVTLTAPTNATSYIFPLSAPNGDEVYDIYVQDSAGQVYLWTEISCMNACLIIIPIYLTPTASGFWRYYYDLPSHPARSFDFTEGMQDCNVYGTVVEAVGNPDVGTTFLGWSYNLADRFTIGNIDWITETDTLNYTFRNPSVTIYGYFTDNGPISLDFCYTPADNPSTITYDDKLYACDCTVNGGATVTVYFNATLYVSDGIENVTWYSDAALTIPVANGYYIDGSQAFSTIYGVTNGIPINHGTCGGGNSVECAP